MKSNLLGIVLLQSLAAVGLFAPGCERRSPTTVAAPGAGAPTVATRYTCSMHPSYVSDKPGNCPICGMKLTPIPASGSDATKATPDGGDGATAPSGYAAVAIDPERRRLIGLKTTTVKRGTFGATIRAVGRVTIDERRQVKVQPRFEGFVEKLRANYTGKFVRKGEVLAEVYSPELLATQNELLLAVRSQSTLTASGLGNAVEAARARLQQFGVGERQIDAIVQSGKPLRTLPIVAPMSGVIVTKNVVAGARIGTDAALFEIADLSRLWVLADVYESELPRLRTGQNAKITLAYWPGRLWQGRVSYIYPTVDEKTRTIRVRIEVPNTRGELKPQMFADVLLEGNAREALLVPEDAVIDSGTRKLVFVSLGDGRLQPREIETGGQSAGAYEVRSGLREGEEVAAGASFLLDSESRLRAAISAASTAPAIRGADGGQP